MARPQQSACDIGAYEYVASPGTATSLGYASGSNQRVAPGTAFSKPFAVYALDSNGSAVSGVTVTFTAPASGPSGTFTDSGTNITTAPSDSGGIAISPTFTANSQPGSYDVTATASGLADSVAFALTSAAWFVAPTGNDSNSCSIPASPCLTISAAVDKAVAGETIYVASGTYTSVSSFVVNINKNITLSGSWDPTFTSRSAPSIIDGESARLGIFVSQATTTVEYFSIENGFFCSGGGILNYGSLTLLNSTIQNNKTDSICGAGGGGIWSYGTLIAKNTTISNNISHHGAGIYISGGSAELNNTTLADNSSTNVGGGIFVESGTLTVRNSIVARNSATNSGPDCSGTINTSDHNILGNTSDCTVTAGTGDQFNVSPMLSTFLPAQGYYPLLPSSPAIDAGNSATCLATDQRGVARVSTCDIGAYEYTTPGSAVSLSVVSGSGRLAGTSSAFSKPLQAAALDSQGSPVSGVTIDFTAPVSGASGTFADTGTNTTSVNTDAGGVATTSIFTANNQAGVYTVSASATGLGSVNFSLEQIFRPANDNFANAEVITSLPFSATPNITDAGHEANEPQACYFMDRTVWYSFTPTETMIVRADTQGSAINGNVNIYRAAGPGISNLQFLSCTGPDGSPTFIAEAGQTYYLQAGPAFGEVGSIQINLAQLPAITGRITDAVTEAPLPGDAPPFASIVLRRCDEFSCSEFVNQQQADSNGRFRFFSYYYGTPLPTGTYQIEVSASLYQTKQVGPFSFVEGQDLDLGDILLTPVPRIGSISGRVIDAVTGNPVSATFAPFVYLNRCNEFGCFTVNSQTPDSEGRFRFETDYSGNSLTVGTYQVVAFADQYEQGQTDPFDVGEGEHRVIDVRLKSFPVRFSEIQPCAEIPASGGDCVYSVKITNGLSTALEGAAWSLVSSALPDSFAGYTDFQARKNQDLVLASGKSKVLRFRFLAPANNSPYGTFVCTRVFVGRGGHSLFNTVGYRDLFCVIRNAGGFAIASPQEAMTLAQESATMVATGTDLEPNNSCQTAQDVGAAPLPFVLDGILDSTQVPDVDFFRFNGTPGASVVVDLEGASTGKGTVGDPFLGFFDSNCNLVALNDDSGTLNSRLEISIPADGVFVLAATVCCDGGFTGGGNGSYQLTVTPVQVIGSISGRVTDAVTGKSLRGDVTPFAFVRLLRCAEFGCFDVNNQAAGSDGRFHFESDFNGAPLRVGNYLIAVSADQYQSGQTDVFTVGEGENRDVGDVPLTSFPVRFSDTQTCAVPPEGGMCQFSVKITNGLSTRLSGKAWSIVNGFGIGSFTNFTAFQTDTPQDVMLHGCISETERQLSLNFQH